MPHPPAIHRTIGDDTGTTGRTAPIEARPHLLEHELADRWRISTRTLQRWRTAGYGPSFLRLGRRVAYPVAEVQHFEATHLAAGASR